MKILRKQMAELTTLFSPKYTCSKDFSFQREKSWTQIDVIVRHRMNPETQAFLQSLLACICHTIHSEGPFWP